MSTDVEIEVDLVSKRSGYLDALAEGSRTKAELVQGLGDSRSTVNRAVAELVEAGAVEELPGECRLTLAGRLAAETFAEFRARTRGIASAENLLAAMTTDTEFGIEMTTGADVWPTGG